MELSRHLKLGSSTLGKQWKVTVIFRAKQIICSLKKFLWSKITILIVYMDDIILIGDDSLEIERLKGDFVS